MPNCCDEHCANYGCNQGRGCPARVAKVGQRLHGPEPISRCWRRASKPLAKATLVLLLLWLLYVPLIAFLASR